MNRSAAKRNKDGGGPGEPARRPTGISSIWALTAQCGGQPCHGPGCRAQGCLLRWITGMGIILDRRPGSGIFNVPAELLEAVGVVRAMEQIDTSIVLAVLDAVEDGP